MSKSSSHATRTFTGDTGELFIQVPHWIVLDARLTATDFRVLCTLLKYAGNKNVCWPGQKALAAAVGRSVKQIYNILNKLKGLGLIGIQERSGDTNLYTLFYKVIHRVINRKPVAWDGRQSVADKEYSYNNKHLNGGFNPQNNKKQRGYLPGWVKIGGKWVKE